MCKSFIQLYSKTILLGNIYGFVVILFTPPMLRNLFECEPIRYRLLLATEPQCSTPIASTTTTMIMIIMFKVTTLGPLDMSK